MVIWTPVRLLLGLLINLPVFAKCQLKLWNSSTFILRKSNLPCFLKSDCIVNETLDYCNIASESWATAIAKHQTIEAERDTVNILLKYTSGCCNTFFSIISCNQSNFQIYSFKRCQNWFMYSLYSTISNHLCIYSDFLKVLRWLLDIIV